MSITLDEYHNAVKHYLGSQENLSWLKEVHIYPEIEGKLETPCALFAVTGFGESGEDDGTGRFFPQLQCELFVVVDMETENSQRLVRDAAMALSMHIHDCRFGLKIKGAKWTSAQPDGFVPELDEYDVWSIQFTQDVEIGEVLISAPVVNEKKVSMSPDIGREHEEDYTDVA